VWYFEVTVLKSTLENPELGVGIGQLGIVFGGKDGMVGWYNNSIGYHADDGHVIDGDVETFATNPPTITAPRYKAGSVVGVHWNTATSEISFILDGSPLNEYSACKNKWLRDYVPKGKDRPLVATVTTTESQGVEFSVNNGMDRVSRPFLVDVLYERFAITCARFAKYMRVLNQPPGTNSSYALIASVLEIKMHIVLAALPSGVITPAEVAALMKYAVRRPIARKSREDFLSEVGPGRLRIPPS